MPLPNNIQTAIKSYCTNHLPDEKWFENEFNFIEDDKLRKRIIIEFKSIRFAYKLYEGIEATSENLIFEIRYQILAYATIYEAIIDHLLNTYYADTEVFQDLNYHIVPVKIDIPTEKRKQLNKLLTHNGEEIITYHLQKHKKGKTQIKFEDKCDAAEKLGIIKNYINQDGKTISLANELKEIYSERNAIHLIAEQRKGIDYQLELSKIAYKRMRPFIDQVKSRLQEDRKSIYAAFQNIE